MKVAIFGQSWLAASLLADVAAAHEVPYVVAPSITNRLATAASALGVEVVIHGRRLDAGAIPTVHLDLLICAHAFVYIPAEVRSRSTWAIGYHPSLLPLHPGRRSIEDTIQAGDRVTGGTVYHLDDGWDTGCIAMQDWCFVRTADTPATLWRRDLGPMGLRLLRQSVAHLARVGALPRCRQIDLEGEGAYGGDS